MPTALDHLVETAQSIAAQQLPDGWQIQWCVWADGDDHADITRLTADVFPPTANPERRSPQVHVEMGNTSRHVGPAACRNIALAHATGELVRQLDADDLLLPGALASDITVMAESPELVWCASGTVNLYEDGTSEPWHDTPDPGIIKQGGLYDWFCDGAGIIEIHAATVCARTDAVRSFGGWAGLWPNEDTYVLLMLSELGSGVYRSEPSHVYRFWDGASTASFDADTIDIDPRIVDTANALHQYMKARRRWWAPRKQIVDSDGMLEHQGAVYPYT